MRVPRSIPLALMVLGVIGGVAPKAGAAAPPATLTPVVFAQAPAGASKPDDITAMSGVMYVTYQNNAGSDGMPAGSKSTVVALDGTGAVIQTWSITGRVDGLTADPVHRRILATANEDLNSTLFLITPGSKALQHLTYSPDPAQKGSDGTNGGTDSVSVGSDGTVYVAHSNPEAKLRVPNNPAAVYRLTVSGASAKLTPLFNVNDTARAINPDRGSPTNAPLGLTDPDSNRLIAGSSGDVLIQDAQADSTLVFATHLSSGTPKLSRLNLVNAGAQVGGPTPQVDDIERVTGPGTLYVADQGSGRIYRMDTASVSPGTYFVSQPKPSKGDLPNRADVGTLNIHSGVVTALHTGLVSPKGLLFIPAPATTTNPPTPPAGTTPAAAGPSAANPDIPTAVPAGSGSLGAPTSTATLHVEIGAAILGLFLVGAGAMGISRRLPRHR